MPTNSKPEKIPLVSLDVAPPEGQQYKELYEGHRVYVRKTQGVLQRLRRNIAVPLMLGFFLLPWLQIDDRQAVFLDVIEQKFYVLWWVFWPQDTILLASLLIIAAFALFAVTVWAGRVWCGFACPQTVWTSIFIWIEGFCEGDRNKRIRLDAAPWSLEKIRKKASKHILWGLVAVATGTTFIAYFYGMIPLVKDLATAQISLESFLWTLLFVVLTYLNAGYMREQVCKHMCPYSRFQSVMYDQSTLMVSYDEQRGEPRGPRKARSDYKKDGLGACIDCDWCVQVCPADIDIRNGFPQLECINCTACMDACDAVMDSVKKPKGLIRYASRNMIEERSSFKITPRIVIYSCILTALLSFCGMLLVLRSDINVNLLRARGFTFQERPDGKISNLYSAMMTNKTSEPAEISVVSSDGVIVHAGENRIVPAGKELEWKFFVIIAPDKLKAGRNDIIITFTRNGEILRKEKISFLSPDKTSGQE